MLSSGHLVMVYDNSIQKMRPQCGFVCDIMNGAKLPRAFENNHIGKFVLTFHLNWNIYRTPLKPAESVGQGSKEFPI
jgi:hypothetical protein